MATTESNSLDPRVNRLGILKDEHAFDPEQPLDQWETFEVFQQVARGDHHQHVGSVHAPTSEMAIVLAKEQYTRRNRCVNLWVVRTRDVFATEYEDADMFDPATDKGYREAYGYKNRELISKFKSSKQAQDTATPAPANKGDEDPNAPKTVRKPRIIVGKR